MDKRSKKAYDKAMDYYEKGKINKALDICELELSESLKNSAILNLKGLLLYQKGDLNGAITVWKINKDFNNDSIAKNYIKDVKADENRLELYRIGESELKKLKIDSAIEIFKKCAESDFNAIKVNTALALCYQRKGDFKNAQEYISKVLNIDENSITAKTIKKELEEVGVYNEKKSFAKKGIIIFAIVVIVVICLGSYIGITIKWKDNKATNNVEQIKPSEDIEQENNNEPDTETQGVVEENKSTENIIENEQKNKNTYFDREKLSTLIENNDVDEIYEELNNVKIEDVKEEDKDIYKQGIALLSGKGVEKFYEYGLWYFNQKNYDNAEIELNKAYEYCNGSYLKEHIIYYRASTLLQKGNNSDALKVYEEYYNQYHKGAYVQGVLYELALLDNDINKEKSKSYANTLINDYPGSIYINDYIANIINN